jgi:hypothetical protein
VRIAVGILSIILAVAPLHGAKSWGEAGHSIVAEIAQRHLDPVVLQRIKLLLGGEVSLASISNWADTVSLTRPETRRWHFVNIPVTADHYDSEKYCPNDDCIIGAIARMRNVLVNDAAPQLQRAEALKFLVHLVADIHQPLHCAERNNDAGATTLLVTFFDTTMSLHMVWDVGLIEQRTHDWGELVDEIEREWLKNGVLAKTLGGQPADWAWQSHEIARDLAYDVPQDLKLSEAYYNFSFPIVERQLASAGIRLGRMLNEALISSR